MTTAQTEAPSEVSCPCCGDPMDTVHVVCWECYRQTDRLTPGVHVDSSGYEFSISTKDVARYERLRTERTRLGALKVFDAYIDRINQRNLWGPGESIGKADFS